MPFLLATPPSFLNTEASVLKFCRTGCAVRSTKCVCLYDLVRGMVNASHHAALIINAMGIDIAVSTVSTSTMLIIKGMQLPI